MAVIPSGRLQYLKFESYFATSVKANGQNTSRPFPLGETGFEIFKAVNVNLGGVG